MHDRFEASANLCFMWRLDCSESGPDVEQAGYGIRTLNHNAPALPEEVESLPYDQSSFLIP